MMIGPAPMIRMLRMSVRFGISDRPPAKRGTQERRTSARSATKKCLCVLRVPGGSCGFHQLHKAIEQVADVVRARARLGMALEAERRPVGARHALQAAVEQRNMGRPH